MRLIDADALIVSECRQCDGDCHCFDGQKCLECNSHNKCQLREAIDYADTVDAVPVVRCRDCRYRFTSSCPMFHEEQTYNDDDGYDWIDHDYTHDDGFCDEGKPKDGEADE